MELAIKKEEFPCNELMKTLERNVSKQFNSFMLGMLKIYTCKNARE